GHRDRPPAVPWADVVARQPVLPEEPPGASGGGGVLWAVVAACQPDLPTERPGGWAWVLWADVAACQPDLPEERPRPLGESRPVTRLVTGRCRSACPAFQLLAVGDAVAALRLL